jgi:hypothetical protein
VIVNWHAHCQPEEVEKQGWPSGSSPLFIDRLLEAQEANGIDLAVVTNPITLLQRRGLRDCAMDAISRAVYSRHA